jgi:hypothetical protein
MCRGTGRLPLKSHGFGRRQRSRRSKKNPCRRRRGRDHHIIEAARNASQTGRSTLKNCVRSGSIGRILRVKPSSTIVAEPLARQSIRPAIGNSPARPAPKNGRRHCHGQRRYAFLSSAIGDGHRQVARLTLWSTPPRLAELLYPGTGG